MKQETLDLAVALRYDGEGAPRVSATGKGLIAEQIIALAKEHDIPLYEEPELVQLLSAVELNEEIPETLYIAVAEIIAFAYQLSGKEF
ncbi:MAG: flagellar protein FhlB [Gammaproteobacteria bacterium]|jgi:flagellar biosynthesis protein|nr:flagellar protein FhlB [Gammaproteobacteria bacterium]MBT7308208.1 flagellar protein FhlB [Gammaproteobacteria bacterium]